MQHVPFRHLAKAAGFCLCAALLPTLAGAQGVVLTPGTLVLQGTARAGEVNIGNPTDKDATFRVTGAYFLQGPDGMLRGLPIQQQVNSALPLLRVGPRQFVLAPGKGQTLRVALRPPARGIS